MGPTLQERTVESDDIFQTSFPFGGDMLVFLFFFWGGGVMIFHTQLLSRDSNV